MEAIQSNARTIVRFGIFEVDLRAGELRRSGVRVKLQEQPFQILAMLLERPGEVVTREEIQRKLWPSDTFVDFEHSINAAVKRLREALDDSADNPRFVETLQRRGYRFIAPVEPHHPPTPSSERRGATTDSPPGSGPALSPAKGGGQGVVAVGAGLAPAATGGRAIRESPLRKRGIVAAIGGALVAVVAALLALNVAGLRDRIVGAGLVPALGRPQRAPLRIHSIAVLPLENLSGDPEQEYFADGMTDELITNLGKMSALRVISRQSTMRYKGSKKPLPEIAKELNVDAVVEGTVQRSGDRVRITANLLHAPTDRHLWAESYERDLRDVLAMQSDVARAIAGEVQAKLTPQEQAHLTSTRSVNREAYEAYLRGRYFWNRRTGEALKRSLNYFEQAASLDPSWALPHSGMAFAYEDLVYYGPLKPSDAYPKAKASAQRALEIDPTLPEAHIALGEICFRYDWDWSGAEREVKRAMELDHNNGTAHYRYSQHLADWGRHKEALAEAKAARDLDPLSPIINTNVGSVLYLARQYDQAIEEFRTVTESDPSFWIARLWLAEAYLEKGLLEQAIAEFEVAANLSSRNPGPLSWLGRACAARGKRSQALQILAELKERSKRTYVPPFHFAVIYNGLGDNDEAFRWLEKAYAEHFFLLTHLKVWPPLDPLRSDPRFQALLRRMNFPP